MKRQYCKPQMEITEKAYYQTITTVVVLVLPVIVTSQTT